MVCIKGKCIYEKGKLQFHNGLQSMNSGFAQGSQPNTNKVVHLQFIYKLHTLFQVMPHHFFLLVSLARLCPRFNKIHPMQINALTRLRAAVELKKHTKIKRNIDLSQKIIHYYFYCSLYIIHFKQDNQVQLQTQSLHCTGFLISSFENRWLSPPALEEAPRCTSSTADHL